MRDWPDLHAALLDMKEGRIEELEKEFGKDRVKFFKTDVTDYQSVQDSFKGALDWRGGFSALIAAAGYATNKSIIETTPEEWRAMISCHLDGTFFANQPIIGASCKKLTYDKSFDLDIHLCNDIVSGALRLDL
jgi:NADP-dependent 3-hydroxy acid dehydrogenase YdfG